MAKTSAKKQAVATPAASSKPAKAPGTSSANTTSGGGSLLWLQGLVCGAIATLATPTALLLGVQLAPALTVALIERTEGRPVGRTMMLFSLAASVGPLHALWLQGHTIAISLSLLLEPRTLAMAWSAAACGWLLCELVPLLIRMALEAGSLSRAAKLRSARTQLEEEWGFDRAASLPADSENAGSAGQGERARIGKNHAQAAAG